MNGGPTRVRRHVLTAVLLVLSLAFLAFVLGPLSERFTSTDKDRASAVNSTRQTALAAVAGVVAVAGLVFTGRTFFLTRRGQLADRYAKAVGLLASDKLTERVGAIFSLRQILIEAPSEHNAILEMISHFVRARASPCGAHGEPVAADVVAGVMLLARRPRRPGEGRINLSGACLRGIRIADANLENAVLDRCDLARTHWSRVNLREASLIDVNLRGARLRSVDLRAAHLHGGDLYDATLDRVDLRGCRLARVDLAQAALFDTDVSQADTAR